MLRPAQQLMLQATIFVAPQPFLNKGTLFGVDTLSGFRVQGLFRAGSGWLLF